MLDRLVRLFRRKAGPAQPSTQARDSFAHGLLSATITFLWIPPRFENGYADGSKEEMLASFRAAMSDIKAVKDGALQAQPFSFDDDGVPTIPLFTTSARAKEFAARYCGKIGRPLPFGVFGTPGGALVAFILASPHVVIDHGSPDARVVTDDHRRFLRAATGL